MASWQGTVLQAIARELHPHEVGNRGEEHPSRAHLLTDENQVDSAASARPAGVDRHVEARSVAMGQPERSGGFDDGSQVDTVDGDIDVAGGSSGIGIPGGDMQEDPRPPITRYSIPARANASARRRVESPSCSTWASWAVIVRGIARIIAFR